MGEPGRIPAVLLLGLVVLLVGGAAAVEVLAGPPARVAAPVPVDPPSRGVLYCPATAREGETARLSVVPAVDAPTEVTVLRYEGGPPVEDDPVALEPGEVHTLDLEGEAAQQPLAVAWDGGPAVATWLVEDRAGAPCEPVALPTSHVAGFDTTGQNDSTLHLFNPFAVDAVVRVTFGTPEGRVALVLTDNVLVPARSSTRMDLNEFEPEQPDLAATVEVLTGRVVTQGELRLRPTEVQPGPTGRVLLPAVGGPEETLAVGSSAVGDRDRSWLALYNPGDRDAAVEVQVSDPDPDSETLPQEHVVPAGGAHRIDLEGVSEAGAFGLVVTSVNEVPVTAARLTHAVRDGGEDVAATLATPPDRTHALAGARTDGRSASLSLFNPDTEALAVTVDAGAGTPASWGALEVAPNGHLSLDLSKVGSSRAMPLRVEAERPVAVDLRTLRSGDAATLWTSAAVPSRSWEGPASRPPARLDPRLSTTPFVPRDLGEGP